MKKSLLIQKSLLRRGGILSRTTRQILAGAGLIGVAASLTSCGDSTVTTFSEEDMMMARVADDVRRVDEGSAQLASGQVENNFYISGLGYYHAGAQNFFEHPYQHMGPDGRYFVDGQWASEPGPSYVPASRPTTAALEKTQQVLAAAQQEEASGASATTPEAPVVAAATTGQEGTTTTAQQPQSSGFGMGNMLLMYMLLSGNRGMFNQGAAFQQAQQQAPKWQQGVNQQRAAVQSHANANPKFREMVAKRSAMGTSTTGSTIRGGMGSTGTRNSSVGG